MVCLHVAALLSILLSPGPEPGPRTPRHPGPPVHLEVVVAADHVDFRFSGEQATVLAWFRPAGASLLAPDALPEFLSRPLPAADEAWLRTAIDAYFANALPFDIDGVPTAVRLLTVAVTDPETSEFGMPALDWVLRADRTELPTAVTVRWQLWERMASETELRLPVLFRAGTQTELVSVDPQEPEHTWRHRAPAPASSAIESPAPLVPVESSGLALPILLALAAALAAGAASMRRGVWRVTGVRWLTVLVAASLGAIAVRTTIRDRSAELPPDAAIEVFELLHRGVYGAFDGADESAIYRRLAAVAVEELCGELYGDVFESLVLRSKGGAFCRIDRIEYLDERHVADPAGRPEIPGRLLAVGAPTFDVHCRWRVDGVVAHWGHEHRRVNEYDAVYVVAADRGAWKLAAVRVLDHRRLDRDD